MRLPIFGRSSQNQEMNPTIPSILALLIGVIWFALWAKLIRKGLLSRKWIDGTGTVSEVRDHSFSYKRPSQYHGAVTAGYDRKSFHVQYEIDGSRYTTANYRFGSLIDTQDPNVRKGLRLPIKINPDDHSEAVVKPGVPKTALLGLIPVVIGIVWMWT